MIVIVGKRATGKSHLVRHLTELDPHLTCEEDDGPHRPDSTADIQVWQYAEYGIDVAKVRLVFWFRDHHRPAVERGWGRLAKHFDITLDAFVEANDALGPYECIVLGRDHPGILRRFKAPSTM